MKITCKTIYDIKTLSAMSLVLRKTLRRRFNRLVSLYLWAVAGLILVSIWLSLEDPLLLAWNVAAFLLLMAVQFKQDALNAFFARRKQIPGAKECHTDFYPDCYEAVLPGVTTQWNYDRILVLAETRDYIVLVLGKNHAQAYPKSGLTGSTAEEFLRFLEQKTGKTTKKFGRW